MNFFSCLCFHRYKHKGGHTALLITHNREDKMIKNDMNQQ